MPRRETRRTCTPATRARRSLSAGPREEVRSSWMPGRGRGAPPGASARSGAARPRAPPAPSPLGRPPARAPTCERPSHPGGPPPAAPGDDPGNPRDGLECPKDEEPIGLVAVPADQDREARGRGGGRGEFGGGGLGVVDGAHRGLRRVASAEVGRGANRGSDGPVPPSCRWGERLHCSVPWSEPRGLDVGTARGPRGRRHDRDERTTEPAATGFAGMSPLGPSSFEAPGRRQASRIHGDMECRAPPPGSPAATRRIKGPDRSGQFPERGSNARHRGYPHAARAAEGVHAKANDQRR